MKRSFTADNTFDAVVIVMRDAAAFLKEQAVSTRALFIAELALEEMLTNIVKYAYDDHAAHTIEVIAAVIDGKVSLEFRDDGRPFDPLYAPPPSLGEPVKTQRIGGRGVHLVKTFVRDITYRHEAGHNILTLSFPANTP
jgi:anti-sigma regulatory factor (Ser/Thr protein kinase)